MRRLLTQLEPLLTSAGLKPDEAFPLIAPLLNLPVPAKYPPLAIFTRTATPPLAGHSGRMDTRRGTSAVPNGRCGRIIRRSRSTRLSMRSVRMMVGQVAARNALSDEAVAAVVERTGGVPLFVEELTRAVLESDGTKLVGREIPVTLHDSLMARLDRLGPGQGSRPGRRGNRRRI